MLIGELNGLERPLAFWALLVGRGILLWVLLTLLPQVLFTHLGEL